MSLLIGVTDYVLEHIISYLNFDDQCCLRLTCKKFNQLIGEPLIRGHDGLNLTKKQLLKLSHTQQCCHIVCDESLKLLHYLIDSGCSNNMSKHLGLFNKIHLLKHIDIHKIIVFYGACQGGHQSLIELMIDQGISDWDLGMHYACIGGHQSVVEFLIKKGADDFNLGLTSACAGGHQSLVKFLIDRGATDLNRGLYAACRYGHQSVIEYLIKKGANNVDIGLRNVCVGGHPSIVQLLIDNGANNLNEGLFEACRSGHPNIVQLLIDKGANQLELALICACNAGHQSVINLLNKLVTMWSIV